jgi:hypothetical protein
MFSGCALLFILLLVGWTTTKHGLKDTHGVVKDPRDGLEGGPRVQGNAKSANGIEREAHHLVHHNASDGVGELPQFIVCFLLLLLLLLLWWGKNVVCHTAQFFGATQDFDRAVTPEMGLAAEPVAIVKPRLLEPVLFGPRGGAQIFVPLQDTTGARLTQAQTIAEKADMGPIAPRHVYDALVYLARIFDIIDNYSCHRDAPCLLSL